jgi:hypothetical protein
MANVSLFSPVLRRPQQIAELDGIPRIVIGVPAHLKKFLLSQIPEESGGSTAPQLSRSNCFSRSEHGAGRKHAARLDGRVVQNSGSHPNQSTIAELTTM